jgi:hypothetical protein
MNGWASLKRVIHAGYENFVLGIIGGILAIVWDPQT